MVIVYNRGDSDLFRYFMLLSLVLVMSCILLNCWLEGGFMEIFFKLQIIGKIIIEKMYWCNSGLSVMGFINQFLNVVFKVYFVRWSSYFMLLKRLRIRGLDGLWSFVVCFLKEFEGQREYYYFFECEYFLYFGIWMLLLFFQE